MPQAMKADPENFHAISRPPLIAHVIHQLDVGGMENGLVNLINHIPRNSYRHAIVCLKGYTDFHKRIKRNDVEIVALDKREGKDVGLYARLFNTFRQLQPDIVHTRNLAAMESQLVAFAAGSAARVHGEHGRDIYDLHGKNRKYNLLRKTIRPFINHYVAVSKDLEAWLIDTVGASPHRVSQIYNGVDCVRFSPQYRRTPIGPDGFLTAHAFVIGSVGRMASVKDYPTLVRAFLILLNKAPDLRDNARLLIVGDGIARKECLAMLREAGADAIAWLPGERADIPDLMRTMDLFVLPSLGEGISNTILEAMSTGLPVVATKVGGNAELVMHGLTGTLVPPGEPEALADALLDYYRKSALLWSHGKAARRLIETNFSMEAMTKGYLNVYDKVLRRAQPMS